MWKSRSLDLIDSLRLPQQRGREAKEAAMQTPVNIPIQFVVHPLPGSAEQLGEKLREVGDRLRNANFGLPAIPSVTAAGTSGSAGTGGFFGGPNVHVAHIEVGPSHFAFLLEDGRVCRLPFSVISDRLDLNRNAGTSSGKRDPAAASPSLATDPVTEHSAFCFHTGAGKSSGKAHVSAAAGNERNDRPAIPGVSLVAFYDNLLFSL